MSNSDKGSGGDWVAALLWFIIKWTFILSWRFFSGAHMNGKTYNDSTWFRDSSKRFERMRHKYSWWKRKARIKRAAWRHCIFWPTAIITALFIISWTSTLLILGFLTPGIVLMNENRIRMIFQKPVVGTHSDGSVHQHWIWKPKYRRLWRKLHTPKGMRKVPGLATQAELDGVPMITDIPVEYERAVRAELAEELNGQPPIELKLLLDPDIDFAN